MIVLKGRISLGGSTRASVITKMSLNIPIINIGTLFIDVMKFNSNSVTLNRGVNYRVPIETPPAFKKYRFSPDVFKNAVAEFNLKLSKRPLVTMHFDETKVDVIRLVPTSEDTLAMWIVVKEKDIDTVHEMCFNIIGDVYFCGDSDIEVFHMIINDVTFAENKGIFTKG